MSPAEFNEMFPNGDNYLLGIIALLILIFALIMRIQFLSERKRWNNGICANCNNGYWKSFDMDSQGGTGYKCTNCNAHVWLDYATWRHQSVDVDEIKDAIIITEEIE